MMMMKMMKLSIIAVMFEKCLVMGSDNAAAAGNEEREQ